LSSAHSTTSGLPKKWPPRPMV